MTLQLVLQLENLVIIFLTFVDVSHETKTQYTLAAVKFHLFFLLCKSSLQILSVAMDKCFAYKSDGIDL